MLILCDFDGTITTEDVTNLMLDHFTGTGWRDEVLPTYWAGGMNHFELMQVLYATLKQKEPELLAVAKTTKFRPGFENLIEYCRDKSYPLAVVSGGLDFYIRSLLPADIPFYSYRGEYDPTGSNWLVRLPDWPEVNLEGGDDFKVRVLGELKQHYPQSRPVVFIGDGRNDGPVAAAAGLVFAVRGSRLVEICQARGQNVIQFEDFAEVIAALEKIVKEEITKDETGIK